MQGDPLQLLDAVLQNAHNGLRATQHGEPVCSRLDLCRLDRQKHEVNGPTDFCGIHPHRAGHGDEAIAIVKRQARPGCAAAQQRCATGFVQCRRDRGADGTGTHNGDGCSPCCIHEHRLLRASLQRSVHAMLALVTGAM